MKKLNLYLLLFFYTNISKSQNLDINKTNPTESLDVNGNINLSGTIKANGVDCLANQVLMKNNTRAMVWGNLADYDMNGAQAIPQVKAAVEAGNMVGQEVIYGL